MSGLSLKNRSHLPMLGPHCYATAISSIDAPCGSSLSAPSSLHWVCRAWIQVRVIEAGWETRFLRPPAPHALLPAGLCAETKDVMSCVPFSFHPSTHPFIQPALHPSILIGEAFLFISKAFFPLFPAASVYPQRILFLPLCVSLT